MGLKADHKYQGTVGPGSTLYESQTGTVAYQVMLACEDGETTFSIWLTERNKAKAEKYFGILGVSLDKLKDPTYLEYGLAQEIEGKAITFGTRIEEYNGKRSVKVSWIGKKSEGKPAQAAAMLFGAKAEAIASNNGHKEEAPITDDDIPF